MTNNSTKRIAAIDYGLARVGIAMSDVRHILASPVTTIQVKKEKTGIIEAIKKAISQYDIEEIVVGLPLSLSGKDSEQTKITKDFIEAFKKQTDIPIKTWDERLTSLQVQNEMKHHNVQRKKRAKVLDVLAAVIILQSYLDSKTGVAETRQ